MIPGDYVKLHIDPGHRAVLDLPDGIGIVQAIEAETEQMSLLVHFDSMSVYVSPISSAEVEVLDILSTRSELSEH